MQLREFPALGERYWHKTLSNGLRLRVIPKPGFARSFAVFATDYGSMDMRYRLNGEQKTSPAGVAHYLEHKMFDLPDVNVMEAFTRTGASPNAFTSYGVTAYYFDCTEAFDENLKLLLRFVSTPYFTPESVEKERGIIGQEIQMYDDSPGSRLSDNLHLALYDHHPVRVPILGTLESIREITADTLYECHEAFYDPANMYLIVIGDLEAEHVAELAERVLPSGRGAAPEKDYGPPEAVTPARTRIETAMEVAMPMFAAGFKCDCDAQGPRSLRESLLGAVASDVLGGESSDLYNRLYRDGLIDASFSVGFSKLPGASMLAVSGDSEDPDAVLDAVLAEVDRLGREGVDEARFQRLKRSALGQRLRNLDSFENICYSMLDNCLEGAEYFDFPQVYDNLTQQDVLDFLQTNVTRQRCALSVIVPKG